MIKFTTDGVEVTASPAQLHEAREEFEKHKLLHLPGLLSTELADMVRRGIEQDGFEEPDLTTGIAATIYRGAYQAAKVGQDLRQGATFKLITSRTNDPRLLNFVETITGSPPLTKCIGHVYRLLPKGDDLPWHTDAEGERLADLMIDLSAVKHEGGRFEMRDARTHEIINAVDPVPFGDGLLIPISPQIEHHHRAITGSVPKVNFSGWFVPKQ
jgi:hypothetical protein